MSTPALVWGKEGMADGQFLRPRAIGVYRGEVYVIDTTGRIQVFGMDGVFRRQWTTPDASNGTPTSIAFSGDAVIVPDSHYSQILEYDFEAGLKQRWGSFGAAPGEFIYPTDIELGADGCYYITEYGEGANRIQVFDADRKLVRHWGREGVSQGEFSRPMSLALDTLGNLFVADMGNGRIQVFDKQGAFLREMNATNAQGVTLKYPFNIAHAPGDTFWAADYGLHEIVHYAADGACLGAFGGPGREPGAFNGPRGVAVDGDGAVYVADTYNHRVQVFRKEDLA